MRKNRLAKVVGLSFSWFLAFGAGLAQADQACEQQCDKEWWCAKDAEADGCNFVRRNAHPAGHKACMAKCWALDKGEAAVEKAGEVIDAAKTKAKETYEAVKEKVVETYDAAKKKASEALQAGKRKASEVVEKVKETASDLKERGKKLVSDAKEKVSEVAHWWNTTWDNAKALAKKAGSKVSKTMLAGYDKLKSLCSRGLTYVKNGAKEIWEGMKSLDCGKIVEGFSRFDLLAVLMSKLWVPAGTCLVEFRKGFYCGIPDMIVTLGKLYLGSAQAAWNNKKVCGVATILAGPLGPSAFMGCGLFFYGKEQVAKMAACFKKLNTKEFFSLLWKEAWKLGCNVLGGIVLDIVIDLLLAGGGTPAIVAKWVKKVGDMLSPAAWMKIANKIGAKSVDAAVSYVQNVSKGLTECK
jgi:gas vesicle protein